MTTQTAPTTEAPEPKAPLVTEQPVAEPPAAPPVAPETPPAPPAVPPAVPPVTPAPPGVDPQVAAYIASLERQNRETQARLAQEAAVTSIARRQEALIAEGLLPERAQAIATEIVQAQTQAQVQLSEMRAKVLYAGQLADQYKVSVAALMQYETPEAMRQAVDRLSADAQLAAENARLKAENAALKKGQVPPQTFDSGRGTGGVGIQDYAELLKSGKPMPTAREIDARTARYLQ